MCVRLVYTRSLLQELVKERALGVGCLEAYRTIVPPIEGSQQPFPNKIIPPSTSIVVLAIGPANY